MFRAVSDARDRSDATEPIDYRPSCGGGSCAACGAALGLDAVRQRRPGAEPVWYCSPGCAQGLPAAARRRPAVAEPRLYNRPRRFHRKRRPKELRSAAEPGSGRGTGSSS